jgi:hypothetical protein
MLRVQSNSAHDEQGQEAVVTESRWDVEPFRRVRMIVSVRAHGRSVSTQPTQATSAIQLGAGPADACIVTVANCAPIVHTDRTVRAIHGQHLECHFPALVKRHKTGNIVRRVVIVEQRIQAAGEVGTQYGTTHLHAGVRE